jgi:D-amino peptidase
MDSLKAYLVADIEGSTGAWSREDTLIGRPGWRKARREMTGDVNAAVEALIDSRAASITVKDFHRDGYNIIPSMLHRQARLVQGYYTEPLLMYGSIHESNRAFFLGMHAGSGNAEGFLSHTLTSRISCLTIGDEPICEAQLFAHVLGEAGVPVAFFSGCPAACSEARGHLPWLVTCPVPKDLSQRGDAHYGEKVRAELQEKIKEAASLADVPLYSISPPYECEITFRDESFARRAEQWGTERHGESIRFTQTDSRQMVLKILQCAYFAPAAFRLAPFLLPLVRLLMPIIDRFRQ